MVTIKLTKTQREVLTEAAKHSKGRVYVQAWHQHVGPTFGGSTKSGGLRKHAAIKALVALGFLDGYRSSDNDGRSPHGENTVYSTEAVAFITEEGRKHAQ